MSNEQDPDPDALVTRKEVRKEARDMAAIGVLFAYFLFLFTLGVLGYAGVIGL